MIRTWKCLLGAWAVCAILCQAGYSQDIEIDEFGTARVRPPVTAPRPADVLYSDSELVWSSDFQPPPGVGVDPVTIPQDNSVGYAVTSDVAQILYRINRINGHYMGLYGDGYTSVNAFVPTQVFDGGDSLFAIDPRAFVSDSGQGGLNLGATFRRFSPRLQRVFVFSQWLDYDRAGATGTGYAQYGLHAASIGKYWSLRGNINLPVGQSHVHFNRAFTGAQYQESFLVLTNNAKLETAYQKFDAEFSLPIPYFARFGFEFGLGAYYLNGAFRGVQDGGGVSTRFETQVTEDVWANALVTSDSVFGSNLSLNFEVTLPNGAPSRIMRRLPIKHYLVQSDKRTYRVLKHVENRPERELAISTAPDFAGNPIFIAHIDPNATTPGDGTVENPFNSLEQFTDLADGVQDDYEIIFVRGNTNGSDSDLNTTVTLFNGQRLLGDGTVHFVDAEQGLFQLQGFGTPTPLLTNSADDTLDVVTLASRNEVSGFTIDASSTARGINGLAGISGFDINRNTIQNTTVGAELTVTGTDDGFLEDNVVTAAVDDGVIIGVQGGVFEMPDGIDGNEISGNGGNGLVIRNLLGGDLDISGIADNDFSDNGLAGVLVDGNGDLGAAFLNLDLGTVDGNDFSRFTSGTIGFEFDTENVLTTATFTSNNFTADSTVNTDANRGVGGRVGGTGGVDLTFGTPANTFSSPEGNTDAHIGLVLDDDTDNVINIEGHDFSNAIDGSSALFNGEGVSLLVRQRADLSGSVTSSTFENNAATGLNINVNGTSFPQFARLTAFTVGGPDVADGNVFRGNGVDGLAFIRTGNGHVGSDSPILIQNNLFEENGLNGFRIDSGGTSNMLDRYTVLNNVSRDNLDDGLQLFIRADAQLDVDMDLNDFIGNAGDGIVLSEEINFFTDLRGLSGTWTRNVSAENGRHGISLDGAMNGLLIGDLLNDNLGNLVELNNNDGIGITGPGSVTIARNLIQENGSNTAGAGDNDAGIDISSIGILSATIFHNDIVNNNGDGIESENRGTFQDFDLFTPDIPDITLDVNENFIAYNDGRGFDVLSKAEISFEGFHGSYTDIDFHDNIINENGEEGVYVISTSSHTQTQDGPSALPGGTPVAMVADGHVNIFEDFVRLRFDMTGNQVLGNGRLSNMTGTGLVVRVGTSGEGSQSGAPFNPFDFVSDGVSVDSDFQNGGIIMRVADNSFGGNFGDSIYFDSFVSTEVPNDTAGTWNETEFTLTAPYIGDPLARLDLHWADNIVDTTDMNNVGAFYDNTENQFKSRDTDQTPAGPFPTGLGQPRRRNAQRLAARLSGVLNPTTPTAAPDYLYPGMGPSSFRVRGNLVEITGDGFALDDFPFNNTNIGDANGVFYPNIFNHQMPYGWTYMGP